MLNKFVHLELCISIIFSFQFSTFMAGNLNFFEHRAGYRTRGSSIGADPMVDPVRSNPAIVQFRQKATHYIAALSKVHTTSLCLLGIFPAFLLSSDFFLKSSFSKKSFRNMIRVSNSLDPGQAWHSVRPNLGPNCLQKLSADGTRR